MLGIADGAVGVVCEEDEPGAVVGAGCGRTIGPVPVVMPDECDVVGACAQAAVAARTPAATANVFRVCFIS